jgi:ParB family chromosome partitioning protein
MSPLDTKNNSLGRGLESLLGVNAAAGMRKAENDQIFYVYVEALKPNRFQPRQYFDADTLGELAESIRLKGILQPILARPIEGESTFEIIAGERRWRAAQKVGLKVVPVYVRAMSDEHAMEAALIENIQRHDLNPIEEAEGYKRLLEEFKYTQEQLADRLKKSRSHLTNTLRLLSLPANVQQLLKENKITAGHARALINQTNAEQMANRIVSENLTVREIEALRQRPPLKFEGKTEEPEKNDVQMIEDLLRHLLDLPVKVALQKAGHGEVKIKFKSLKELDGILARFDQANSS